MNYQTANGDVQCCKPAYEREPSCPANPEGYCLYTVVLKDLLPGTSYKYTIGNDRVTVTIEVDKNEILLLDNIDFVNTDDLQIKINSNTKSSEVITLSVGDHYTDGELMTRFKNNGYNCK